MKLMTYLKIGGGAVAMGIAGLIGGYLLMAILFKISITLLGAIVAAAVSGALGFLGYTNYKEGKRELMAESVASVFKRKDESSSSTRKMNEYGLGSKRQAQLVKAQQYSPSDLRASDLAEKPKSNIGRFCDWLSSCCMWSESPDSSMEASPIGGVSAYSKSPSKRGRG